MRARPAVVAGLVACLGLPIAAVAAGPGVVDPTVAAARDTEAVILTGASFGDWAVPANVTAQPPAQDLTDPDCPPQSTGGDPGCQHNHYVKPAVDSSEVTGDTVQGTDVTKLSGWKWDGTRFVEVPFQVDEMFVRYLDNSASGFAIYSGQDQHLGYAFDREGFRFTKSDSANPCLAVADSPTAVDPVKGLDTNDEVAFMAKDAGAKAPTTDIKGATAVKTITVADPSNAGRVSYLYVAQGLAPTFTKDTGYVRYERDANAGTFEKSESSYDNYGNAAKGTYCDADGNVVLKNGQPDIQRRRPRDTATVTTSRYKYRYDGRWLMTSIQVSDDDGATYGPDLVDRWKARAFAQDPGSETPCCGYEEEDTNWGGSSTLMGERSGPVRTIRETWGADSGTNVVRRETFYQAEMRQRTFLRVHVIPPLDGIYAQWDYNAGAVDTFYNPANPKGVAVDGRNDELVGNFDDPCNPNLEGNDTSDLDKAYRSLYQSTPLCDGFPYHQSVDPGDPTFQSPNVSLDWTEITGPNGTVVSRYQVDPGSVTPGGLAQSMAAVPYYRDDSCFDDGTGSNPGPKVHLRSADEPKTYAGGERKCWRPSDGTADLNSEKYFQGSIGTTGVHLLFLVDSDNARQQVPLNEITVENRQVYLPGRHDATAGEQYGRGFEKPLVAVVS